MKTLAYTLLSDGVSDRALMPILDWLLHQLLPDTAVNGTWADLGRLPRRPKGLPERISQSVELYPCELLFVHRDAEREAFVQRIKEIDKALNTVPQPHLLPPIVHVVPVRMQEAWLLFDEAAIRAASGNPRGRTPLELPRVRDVESIPDPKDVLHGLLRAASGPSARRRRSLPLSTLSQRVPQFIDDFTPLRQVASFTALQEELEQVLRDHGWRSYHSGD